MRRLLSSHLVPATLVLALLSFAAPPTVAQVAGTATLRGTVADATGGVLPYATVLIVHEATGDTREATTDVEGGFTFASVFAGPYTVRAALDGFRPLHLAGVRVSAGDSLRLALRLDVGVQSDAVVVTATPEIVRHDSGAREHVVSGEQLRSYSLIGRSALELIRVLPGVLVPDAHWIDVVSFTGGMNHTMISSLNGVTGLNNSVTVDGTNTRDTGANTGTILSPNVEMLQELRVQTGHYAAEYGSSGVQISAVTRSGSSTFRGSAYGHLRDWRLTSNDRSNRITGVEKPRSTFQYPGVTLGGPLALPGLFSSARRDRIFFFAGLEYQRQRVDQGSSLMVVPTARQRTGDFGENLAGAGSNLNQPRTVLIPAGWPGAGTPAPGNDLAPYVTPLGRVLADLYPLPNYSDPSNRYNYVDSMLRTTDRLEWVTRVDLRLHTATQAYVRVARQTEERENPSGIYSCNGCSPQPTSARSQNVGQGIAANVVTVVSPRLVSELTASYAKLELDARFSDEARLAKATYDLHEIGFFGAQSPLVPATFTMLQHVSRRLTWAPLGFANDTLQVGNKLAWAWRTHALKAGGAFERANKWQGTWNTETGLLTFAPWTPGGTGHELGDLLVGRPFNFEQGTKPPLGHFRFWNAEAFAQDTWRIRRNVTLEAGVRFAYLPNNAEVNGLGAVFLPEFYDRTTGAYPNGDVTRLNGVRYAARDEVPRRLLPNRRPTWMPRVNVAWDLRGDGSTTLRGGVGTFVNRHPGGGEAATQYIAPHAYYGSINAFDGLPLGGGAGLTYDTIRTVDPFTRLPGVSARFPNPASIYYPQTTSMSAALAQRLGGRQVAEAAYVGTRNRHMMGFRDPNAIPAGALFSGHVGNADLAVPVQRVALGNAVLNQFRPFPAYQGLSYFEFEESSRYDALQLTFSRTAGDLQFLVGYAFSKATGTQTGIASAPRPNPIDPARSSGRLEIDHPHNLVGSFTWTLPSSGSSWRLWRAVANGWQVSGIGTALSGLPYHLNFTGDIASAGVAQAWFGTPSILWGAGVTGVAPLYVRDPRVGGGTSPGDRLLDLSAIAVPEFGQDGQPQPPFDLRTPGWTNLDLTVSKHVRVGGDRQFQLRAGVFNVFNTTYFGRIVNGAWVGDVDLRLDTRCKVQVNNVPNGMGGYAHGVCDPTGGFEFTEQTQENFGRIRTLRGRRVVQLSLRYSW
jgi:hypothetical protein